MNQQIIISEEKVRIDQIKSWLKRYIGQISPESRVLYALAFKELADEIELKS